MIYIKDDKVESRKKIIIDLYRQHFGKHLPENKLYWTMCADCQKNNKILEKSELHQIIYSGLIKKEQFRGVDINKNIIKNNKKIKGMKQNFIYGDFYKIMASQPFDTQDENKDDFSPGIVNYDTTKTFEVEKDNIKKIFYMLEPYKSVLFTFNVVLKGQYVKLNGLKSVKEISDYIYKQFDFSSYSKNNGWYPKLYKYPYKGTGPTIMYSVGMIKY